MISPSDWLLQESQQEYRNLCTRLQSTTQKQVMQQEQALNVYCEKLRQLHEEFLNRVPTDKIIMPLLPCGHSTITEESVDDASEAERRSSDWNPQASSLRAESISRELSAGSPPPGQPSLSRELSASSRGKSPSQSHRLERNIWEPGKASNAMRSPRNGTRSEQSKSLSFWRRDTADASRGLCLFRRDTLDTRIDACRSRTVLGREISDINVATGVEGSITQSLEGTESKMVHALQGYLSDRVEDFRPSFDFVQRKQVMRLANPKLRSMGSYQFSSLSWKAFVGVFSMVYSWFRALEEPERSGWLARWVESRRFESLCLSVIVANSMFIIYTTDYELFEVRDRPGELPPRNDVHVRVEICFLSFYIFEMCLKLMVHRLYFFCNADMSWNWFDAGIITTSALDMISVMMADSGHTGGSGNLMFFRICRLLNISKSFRMFRALQFVRDLRLLVDCVVGCTASLFWCSAFLLFILNLFAVWMNQAITDFLRETEQGTLDEDLKEELARHFGTVFVTMLSLFMATTGGVDWIFFYELLSKTNKLCLFVYLLYVFFFVIAAWNIVNSVFIQNALKAAKPNMDAIMVEKRREDVNDAKMLLQLVQQVDKNKNGMLSLDEFMNFMSDEKFRSFFEVRGLDIKDAELFFRMLAAVTDTEEVDLGTFVSGCMSMRGHATSIDIYTLSFELKIMHITQRRFFEHCAQELWDLRRKLAAGGTGAESDGCAMSCATGEEPLDAGHPHGRISVDEELKKVLEVASQRKIERLTNFHL